MYKSVRAYQRGRKMVRPHARRSSGRPTRVVNRLTPKQVKEGAGVYSQSRLSEWQINYVMALLDGLRLINEKAKEKGMSDEPLMATTKHGVKYNTGKSEIDNLIDADALVHYVRRRGDQLAYIYKSEPIGIVK